jgi:hypothetical protein
LITLSGALCSDKWDQILRLNQKLQLSTLSVTLNESLLVRYLQHYVVVGTAFPLFIYHSMKTDCVQFIKAKRNIITNVTDSYGPLFTGA